MGGLNDYTGKDNDAMDMQRQQQLRLLAQKMAETDNAEQRALATETLELLDYSEELQEALDEATAACCDAVAFAYDYDPLNRTLAPDDFDQVASTVSLHPSLKRTAA